MAKSLERELGEINATLTNIQENQKNMHDDIKQLSTCMSRIKIDTEANNDFRINHLSRGGVHDRIEERITGMETFKTRIYGMVAGVSLVAGAIGSQFLAVANFIFNK